ncbi:MAG: hypothetical protein J6Q55_04290, partial [Clostridia bacterium]|nr:hypothetical protein [Clostridia bacterium]
GTTEEPVAQPPEQPAPVEQIDEVTTTVAQSATTVVEQPHPLQQEHAPEQDHLALFDINQDDAETFISDFDKLATASSQKLATGTSQPKQGENYQHTLLNIIGDQLDEVTQVTTAPITQAAPIDSAAELEEVADQFAREGIRLRIYNHAAANFKSKTLIPLPQVLCKTTWITYVAVAIILALLSITSIGVGNWLPPLITLGVLLLLPVAVTIYALANPIRTEKPNFNYNVMILGTLILAAIVILITSAISIFNHIELSNYAEITNKILIPAAISLLPSAFVVVFNYYYKKY